MKRTQASIRAADISKAARTTHGNAQTSRRTSGQT